MNVEFQCRQLLGEGTQAERLCGNRYQLPPGNPHNIKCRFHTDDDLVQVEGFGGADFFYVDEGGQTRSAGHVQTQGARNQPVPRFAEPEAPTVVVPEQEQWDGLAEEWRRLTGRDVDGRWGLDRLRAEVQVQQAAEATAKAEAAAQGASGAASATAPAPAEPPAPPPKAPAPEPERVY